MKILVINAGSSSLKYQLLDMDDESVIAKGNCDRIGIGGHINPVDEQGDLLMRGLWREIHEEVEVANHGELMPCGFINDDSNAVGSVHLGACFTMSVEGTVSVKETEKLEGLWMTKQELQDNFDSMETWTQIALEVL